MLDVLGIVNLFYYCFQIFFLFKAKFCKIHFLRNIPLFRVRLFHQNFETNCNLFKETRTSFDYLARRYSHIKFKRGRGREKLFIWGVGFRKLWFSYKFRKIGGLTWASHWQIKIDYWLEVSFSFSPSRKRAEIMDLCGKALKRV